MTQDEIIDWLLVGDPAIQYQTYRDLLDIERPDIRARIAREGWGAQYLAARKPDGVWGDRFYQPKWISSHYTLLDLKLLNIAPDHDPSRDSIRKIFAEQKADDGGIRCGHSHPRSDVCVNGMVLNYASYFGTPAPDLVSIIDFLLGQHMQDGGFNCMSNRSGAHHSSLHSTISVLEGIHEYLRNGHAYRADELKACAAAAREFVLLHRFYKSDHTGEIIRKDFLQLSFPPRWYYNILRALDYFQAAQIPWDDRMQDAIDVLRTKRRKDGRWRTEAARAGQVHFKMEQGRQPSRWTTLMALRVLRVYGQQHGK
ncbi:hypothetical protein MXMO3_02492 [Maritalea myrionectae]|uniref:Uncharacterized protein n=1 Tax=Maritalea myrionectae TaxID=454601 RepID=A0A2R4MGI9_9HYPH|nr:hypothetical protein [Maritalea myrionectae]AVX05004.1 hypothetical protein MXMO3_02492 [Maritalea myrionectae]